MGYDTPAAAGSAAVDVSADGTSDGKVSVSAASVDAPTAAGVVSFAGADVAADTGSVTASRTIISGSKTVLLYMVFLLFLS